ncbi:MAG: hypothetical protein GY750_05030 [Lentisphaerae bacterium]|nr:hypothetical protein [Lentisphaerota bacterium]
MLRVGMQAVALRADISGASVICQEIKAAQNSRHSEDIRAKRYSLHSHAKHGNEKNQQVRIYQQYHPGAGSPEVFLLAGLKGFVYCCDKFI